jgi:predicted RNase H-like nuclease
MTERLATRVGVDGCRAGWIAVSEGDGAPAVEIHATFRDIVECHAEAVIAVDMPIGLPHRTSAGGRGPERAVRPLLGARQSSVFAIPSRSAVYAPDYRAACAAALATSTPPKKVSRQAFNLFGKIREIDSLIDARLELRVYEVHPEVAFWRLNRERPLAEPKKVKGRVFDPGMRERRALLASAGFAPEFLAAAPPRGAALDDFLDACACLAIARRVACGLARPFPDPPLATEAGIRMAIWA